MTVLTDQAAWRQLEAYFSQETQRPLERTAHHEIHAAGLHIDYSRNHLNDTSLALFSELADQCELSEAFERLFAGNVVNRSENRAAWHTVMRDPDRQPEDVQQMYSDLRHVASRFQEQEFTDIVHVGIGGSYLGTRFLFDAFASIKDPAVRCHFIANQNTDAIQKILRGLDPKKTALIVVSKSFTTVETMTNAQYIIAWLQAALPSTWQEHMLAVTAHHERASAFGFSDDAIFPMWDWLGGRFSLWSAVSFSLVMAYGWPMFDDLLQGAYAMDQHVQSQPWTSNAPVILAFIGLLYRHFFNAQSQVVIPYHNSLTRLISHLQQLHMESLGRHVSAFGEPLDYPTGAIIWGGTGPGSQHSFHQLLLQGRDVVPVDFIVMQNDPAAYRNCIAQATALLKGNRGDDVPAYEDLPGNRPSTIIKMPELAPRYLGALLALYEHKVFAQSILWHINAFDQWGVEAGKKLIGNITV